jgi:hypothetical protein
MLQVSPSDVSSNLAVELTTSYSGLGNLCQLRLAGCFLLKSHDLALLSMFVADTLKQDPI